LEAVDARIVPIVPPRLQGITADDIETRQLKTSRPIAHVGPGDVAEHIRFPAARRARAGSAKELQIKIRFHSVIPLNGEFVSDLLDVGWLKTHRISSLSEFRRYEQLLSEATD
jgi:hypothetical protein